MTLLTPSSSLDRNDNAVRGCYWALLELRQPLLSKVGDDSSHVYRLNNALKAAVSTIRANWTDRCAAATFSGISEFGDHMTAADWLDCVKEGSFIDYDGSGRLATETQESSIDVNPSDIATFGLDLPAWATHVMWFNR